MELRMQQQRVPIARAALALLAGSLVGALLVPLLHVGTVLIFAGREFVEQWRPQYLQFFLLEFAVAWIVIAAGLLAIGIPGWWAFHRAGRRGWRAAAIFGLVATFVGALLFYAGPWIFFGEGGYSADGYDILEDGRLTSYGWSILVMSAAEIAPFGAIVAVVIWKLAYRGA